MAKKPERVALVLDHLAQRGGAERVAFSLLDALQTNRLYTSVFVAKGTYPRFAQVDVRSMWFSRVSIFRKNHRYAFPFMAPGFSRLRPKADITFAATAGWAHGAKSKSGGRKIVYWYAPPRWLYQKAEYLSRRGLVTLIVRAMSPSLTAWDRRAVASIDRHLAVSNEVANRLRRIYKIDAEVLYPPVTLDAMPVPVADIEPGYFLIVSRLMSYKNVHVIADAMRKLPGHRLIVVGTGPFEAEVRRRSPQNVHFAGSVSDGQLAWLYENCEVLIAAAQEDFGLTPLEAAHYGRPSVTLHSGGYLDTIEEGVTGEFFPNLSTVEIVSAIERALTRHWDSDMLRAHAACFSEEQYVKRIQEVVEEELACLPNAKNPDRQTS